MQRPQHPLGPDRLQKTAMSIMAVMAILTFLATNVQALLWQSSDWLVSTVLPAVVVDLTNTERSEVAAAPLRRNALLDEAARQKAEHMASNGYFAHYSPDGVSPWYWFDTVGYAYAHAGENLAIHFTDSSEVVEAWMNSPAHKENIVANQYTEIGVGTAKGTYDGYDTVFVVQLFGAPAAISPNIDDVRTILTVEPETPVAAKDAPVLEAVDVVERSPVIARESVEQVGISVAPNPENVVVQTTLVATSSGLAVATIVEPVAAQAGTTAASIATQPNTVLQYVYILLGIIAVSLLAISIVLETRRFHIMQVAYGVALLIGMGGLWYIHIILTSGAVIA